MTTWFIRLGRKQEPYNQALYQDFAEKYSLIKIGYGITEDITHLNNAEDIAKHITSKNKRSQDVRARLVNKFINEMNIGDTIICPFNDGSLRIAKVISACGTIDSFFTNKKELAVFIAKHPNTREPEYIEYKPARKVKWLNEDTKLNDLPQNIQQALARSMRATVTKLNVGIVEDEEEKLDTVISEKVGLPEMMNEINKYEDDHLQEVDDSTVENFIESLMKSGKWLANVVISASISSVISISVVGIKYNQFLIWILFTGFIFLIIGIMVGYFFGSHQSSWGSLLRKVKNGFREFIQWCYGCPDHCCCCKCKRY